MLQELLQLDHEDAVMSLCFHPRGTLLATGTDHVVSLWGVEDWELKQQFLDERAGAIWATTVRFSPDGSILAAGTADGSVATIIGHTACCTRGAL